MNETKIETVTRETLPTASFSLKVSHIVWIARKAKAVGTSKSELMRTILDRAIADEQERAA